MQKKSHSNCTKRHELAELWSRVTTWFANNTPPGRYKFASGASASEVKQAEAALKLKFPKEVRDSYLIHNGSLDTAVLIRWSLMSLSELVQTWQAWSHGLESGAFDDPGFASKPKGPIRPDWFNPKWMPVAENENGDYVYVDLAPAKGGTVGQLIDFWRDGDGATNVLAQTFDEWLANLADRLDSGKVVFDRRLNRLVEESTDK
jgi:cell wall assembly regulator SMI1